jgi:hypothetical protein
MTSKQSGSGTRQLHGTTQAGKNSKTKRAAPAADASASAPLTSNSPESGLDSVSASLRQAYQTTLDEAIPDEMLDLLRKLD